MSIDICLWSADGQACRRVVKSYKDKGSSYLSQDLTKLQEGQPTRFPFQWLGLHKYKKFTFSYPHHHHPPTPHPHNFFHFPCQYNTLDVCTENVWLWLFLMLSSCRNGLKQCLNHCYNTSYQTQCFIEKLCDIPV